MNWSAFAIGIYCLQQTWSYWVVLPHVRRTHAWLFIPMMVAIDAFIAVSIIIEDPSINVRNGIDGAWLIIWLHAWWKNRPPRKRKPSRILGRIQERLGRLVIVNG